MANDYENARNSRNIDAFIDVSHDIFIFFGEHQQYEDKSDETNSNRTLIVGTYLKGSYGDKSAIICILLKHQCKGHMHLLFKPFKCNFLGTMACFFTIQRKLFIKTTLVRN